MARQWLTAWVVAYVACRTGAILPEEIAMEKARAGDPAAVQASAVALLGEACKEECQRVVGEVARELLNNGKVQESHRVYEMLLPLIEHEQGNVELQLRTMNQVGLGMMKAGNPGQALNMFAKALRIYPDYVYSLLNQGVLLQEHFHIADAITSYKRVITLEPPSTIMRLNALNNLGAAYVEAGDAVAAIQVFNQLLSERINPQDFDEMTVRATLATARRTICDWTEYEANMEWMKQNIQLQLDREIPLSLPLFDTLLMPLDGIFRRRISQSHASSFQSPADKPDMVGHLAQPGPIKVGYLSYDYTDHPTAHLIEDLLFDHLKNDRVESHTLGYGKDDNSVFRDRIAKGANFHNLVLETDKQALSLIRDKLALDILVDLQSFTRASRIQLTLSRPAPIIVNYLIFPGTSGASWVDYFIGDKYASPLAETARHFSERLVIMPHSYQVNTFARYIDVFKAKKAREAACGMLCLPDKQAPFVFANLNKQDKIEPASFASWMRILRRVPNSVLWLLTSSHKAQPELLRANIRSAAKSAGVQPERIIFLPRIPKSEHIARHIQGGLFLDTFTYGAHSTATDALRGGLPFLTLVGNEFAARVGKSLTSTVNMPYMSTYSVQEFEDVAVRIATSPALAAALKRQLFEDRIREAPLFQQNRFTDHLERGYQAMVELRLLFGNRANRHILVAQ